MPFKELVIILFVFLLTKGTKGDSSPSNGHIGNALSGSQSDTIPENAERGDHDLALDYPVRINTTHKNVNLSVRNNNVHKGVKETSDTFPPKTNYKGFLNAVKTKTARNAPSSLFAPCSKGEETGSLRSVLLNEDQGSSLRSLDALQSPSPSADETVSVSNLPSSLERRNEQTSFSDFLPAPNNKHPEGQDHALPAADAILHAASAVSSVPYSQIPRSNDGEYDIASVASKNPQSTELVLVEEAHASSQDAFVPDIAIYFPLASPSLSDNLNDEPKFGNSFSQGDGADTQKSPHFSSPLPSQHAFASPGSSDGQFPTVDGSQAQSKLSAVSDDDDRIGHQRGVPHGIENFARDIHYVNQDNKPDQTLPTGKDFNAPFSTPDISATQSHPPTENSYTPTFAAQAASSGKNSDCSHQQVTGPLTFGNQKHSDGPFREGHRNPVTSVPTLGGGNIQSADSSSIWSTAEENGGITEKFPFSAAPYQRGRNHGRSGHSLLISSAASTMNGNEQRGSRGPAPSYPANDSGSPIPVSMRNEEMGFSISEIRHSTSSENHAKTISSPRSIPSADDKKYEGYNSYASSAPFVPEQITREGATQSVIPVEASYFVSVQNYGGPATAPSASATLTRPSAWKHPKPAPIALTLPSFSSGTYQVPSIPDSLTPDSLNLNTKSMPQSGSSSLPARLPQAEMFIPNGRSDFNTQPASVLPNERYLGDSRAFSPLVSSAVSASSNEGFSYSFRSSSMDPSRIRKDQSSHLPSPPLSMNVHIIDRLPSVASISYGSDEGKHMHNFAMPSDLSGSDARGLGGEENTYGAKFSSVSLDTGNHLNPPHSASPFPSVFTELNSRTVTKVSGPVLPGPVPSPVQNGLGYGSPRPTPATHAATDNDRVHSLTLTKPIQSGTTFEGSLPALPDYREANFGGYVSSTQSAHSSPETGDHTASETLPLSVKGWSGPGLRDSSVSDMSVAQRPSERDSTGNKGGQPPRNVQSLPLDTGNNGKRQDTFSTGIVTSPVTHTCSGNSQSDEAGTGVATFQHGSGGQQHFPAHVVPGVDARPLFQRPSDLADQRKVVPNGIYDSRRPETPAQRNSEHGSSHLLPTRNYSPETTVATRAKDSVNHGSNRGAGRIDNGDDTKAGAYGEGAFAIPPAFNSAVYSQGTVDEYLGPLSSA